MVVAPTPKLVVANIHMTIELGRFPWEIKGFLPLFGLQCKGMLVVGLRLSRRYVTIVVRHRVSLFAWKFKEFWV